MKKAWIYIKSIIIPLIIGGIVGLIMSNFIDYDYLNKPLFAPPGVAFPIAWTILYILMGVSYAILENKGLNDKQGKTIYYLQLFVNALWSIFFFVFKWRLFSFFWLILLGVLIIIMIINFYRKNKIASLIQIPYLLWVIFASYLNISIFLLNR